MLGPHVEASQTSSLWLIRFEERVSSRSAKYSPKEYFALFFLSFTKGQLHRQGQIVTKGHGLGITEVYREIFEFFPGGLVPDINECCPIFPGELSTHHQGRSLSEQ
jgi:hypothetical protein